MVTPVSLLTSFTVIITGFLNRDDYSINYYVTSDSILLYMF